MALDDIAPWTARSCLRLLKQPKPVTHNAVVKQLRIRFRIEYGLPREVPAGLEMSWDYNLRRMQIVEKYKKGSTDQWLSAQEGRLAKVSSGISSKHA